MMKMLRLAIPLSLMAGLAACSTAPPPTKSGGDAKTSQRAHDSRRIVLELLRQAPDPARCWEALQLLNAEPVTPIDRLALDASVRTFLQETVGLTADELQEVEFPGYRRADADYVSECMMLHDAARVLEVHGVSPGDLANRAFGWVRRQVLLHQQGDDWLPPAQVLRRGHGSARDRAWVFLALMRQLRMEGVVFVRPEAPDDILLVGVHANMDGSLYLLDPKRGFAVQAADGRVATLKDVRAEPKLLVPVGLDAKQFASLEARLACPLSALSPRMRELEQMLSSQDRTVLHMDVSAVRHVITVGNELPVRVWNTPARNGQVDNSPTRALRMFLPADEGGTDSEKPRRQEQFRFALTPWTQILLALDEIKLGRQHVPEIAQPQLLQFIGTFFERYDRQPHDLLLRGKGAEAVQRLERIRSFLEDESLLGLTSNAEFQQAAARWREQLREAYAALAARQPDGQALVNKLWGEDQYVLTLLQVDGEDRLATQGRGEERPPPPKRTALTSIIAVVARDHLNQRALWLRAMDWHEKAERDRLRAGNAPAGITAAGVRSAWLNSRSAWNLYLDRAGWTQRRQQVGTIRAMLKQANNRQAAVEAAHLLEALHLDMHRYFAARIHHAGAVFHVDGAQAAAAQLRTVEEELRALLEKDSAGQRGLQGEIDAVRQRVQAASSPAVARSLELLQNDWTPEGNVFWLSEHVRAQLARWEKQRTDRS